MGLLFGKRKLIRDALSAKLNPTIEIQPVFKQPRVIECVNNCGDNWWFGFDAFKVFSMKLYPISGS